MSDGRGQTLKSLNSQLQAAEMSLKLSKAAFDEVSREYNAAKQRLESVQRRVDKIKADIQAIKTTATAAPIVTEHAMMRFVQRVLGITNDELVARIVPPDTMALIKQIQSGKIPVNDPMVPFRLVVKNGVVITVET